ncbi:hypothetical protein JCM8547_002134 [Rhodosporidiobolus lusitaniae]
MLAHFSSLVVFGAAALGGVAAERLFPDGGQHLPHKYFNCIYGDRVGCKTKSVELRVQPKVDVAECGTVELDWTSEEVPRNSGATWSVYANTTYPWRKNVEAVVEGQGFVTPATSLRYEVAYPEGTEIEFTATTFWNDTLYTAKSKSISVGPVVGPAGKKKNGGTDSCVPATHQPIFVHWPEKMEECEPVVVRWENSTYPLTADIYIQEGNDNYYSQGYLHASANEVMFSERYHAGANVTFVLRSQSYSGEFTRRTYTIQRGSSSCKIPKHHRRGSWLTKGRLVAIIVGSVLTGSLAIAAVAWAVWKYVVVPRRERGVQLP